ncbi:apoptosis-inducing factor 3-like [Liolophura sinensis]|uniref:apoptosis-inducing factor 3-like n=1 Tax=Liolophura sinensis TaxID=3198878 RepID=UPI0031599136
MSSQSGERITQVVCDVGDLKDGEMRDVEVGEGKALLVRSGGQYYAVSAKCTHYGAPLSKGALCNDRVRCPWHGACFNVKTGDIEEYPGLDSLQKFEVEVSDGKVKVTADKTSLSNHKRIKPMCRASPSDSKTVLIIGGGPASVACAETLRQNGFKGKITLATKEECLPYDRIKLSKAMSTTADAIALRSKDFYESYDIDIQTNKEAVSVDTSGKSVKFSDGSVLPYTSLVLATGGRPRTLPVPGKDLKNVCLLRTPKDANYIASEAAGKNVVIIGSSFIGMEVASSLASQAASITVVDIIALPFQTVLGDKVGTALQKMHEEKGIKFHFKAGLSEIVGENGQVKEVVLDNGTRLPADLVVLGVGVAPATEFAKDSGLNMTKQGFIQVDKKMKTNLPDVLAAGDIVEFPLFTVNDEKVNIGHWQMAHHHGRIAAYTILGKLEELHSVPYFWTVQYGKSIRYTGYGPGYDDIIIHGNPDELKFVAYYTKGEKVVAAASLNFDPIVSEVAEALNTGREIKKEEVRNDPRGWVSKQ